MGVAKKTAPFYFLGTALLLHISTRFVAVLGIWDFTSNLTIPEKVHVVQKLKRIYNKHLKCQLQKCKALV